MASPSLADLESGAAVPDDQTTSEASYEKRAQGLRECAKELDLTLPMILEDKEVPEATKKKSIAAVMEAMAKYLAVADAYDACKLSEDIMEEQTKDMIAAGDAFVSLETNAEQLQEVSGDLLDDVPEGIPEDLRDQILDSAEGGVQAYHAARQALNKHRDNIRELEEITRESLKASKALAEVMLAYGSDGEKELGGRREAVAN